MQLFGVGNVLLYYREKKKFTQLQLCEGICNEMTMSRIETGEREFDSLISDTLLERLGKTTNRLEFVLNDEDYYYYLLRENIVKAVFDERFELAKQYIKDYRNNIPKNHVLHEQFLLFYEALIMKGENRSVKDIVSCLYHAINLTRADFREQTTRLRLYSGIEIKIIFELFVYENYSYESMEAVFRYIDDVYDEEVKRQVLTPFLYEYAERYYGNENWYELKKITQKAIELLQGGRVYQYLLELHFMNLVAEYSMNPNSNQLLQRCNAIYYMAMTVEDDDMMKKAECFCKERLGCQITM